ncbi:MFS transporter [Amycolatopsis plumensis]|uniref:MFS transporter n=1 Tax=Amycolatopsis plumensis TaxID=236508 RepID=UPI00361A1608
MQTGSAHGRAALLAVTGLGQFMVLLDSTIVGAALPDMQWRLGTGLSGLQWIVDAYVLLVAMLLLSGGVFADRFGRKRVFLAGVAVFTAASAVCSAAPSLGWLVAGRVLQGVGAAALSPASLALLAAAHRCRPIGCGRSGCGPGSAVGQPELAILDELTTGLDPHARRETWRLVEGVRATGVTVLLVTHFMDEAERLCDRVAIFDAGRVVATGTPTELRAAAGASTLDDAFVSLTRSAR